ncbi:MAG: arylsulfatase [Planctomycetaceae bacterium]|nr:arylsulfatase [Planctomycetaceae bacterium]
MLIAAGHRSYPFQASRRVYRLVTWSLISVGLFIAVGPASIFAAPIGKRPNIVFVITDDQGYGDLGRHGNPILKTPNLDKLYDESVRFTDFHVSPTCSPTRSAIMTGRHEFKNGVTHTIQERERLTLGATTIAQLLKQAGYRTGIFGKWHLGDEDAYQPGRRGFDEVFIHGAGGIGQTYPGSCGDAPANRYFDPAILHNGVFEKTSGYCTDVFFNQAMKWIEQADGQTPFFAYIATNAPHAPLDCPERYEAMYRGQVPENVAKFLGMVTNIDDNIGRLLAKLKERKIDEQTLVIFMNDNGGTAGVNVFNAGMRAQKGTPYLGGTRAMSLWRWPGVLQPHDVSQLAAHIDYFPTLATLAEAKLPPEVTKQVEGYSLLPLLRGEKVEWPDRMLFTHVGRWPTGAAAEHKFSNCSVRWRNYHLVRTRPLNNPKQKNKQAPSPDSGWQLYDVSRDIGEQQNLASEQSDIVTKLTAAYDTWWQSALPGMVNEQAGADAPKINPFHERYWKQYRGPGPNGVAPPAGFLSGN